MDFLVEAGGDPGAQAAVIWSVIGIVGAVAGFLVIWIGVCHLIASIGAWRKLATTYREAAPIRDRRILVQADADRDTEKRSFQYARVGLASYKGALTVEKSEEGLGLSLMRIFRPGHPPLLIPWHKISVIDSGSSLMGRWVTLSIGRPELATIQITPWAAEGYLDVPEE